MLNVELFIFASEIEFSSCDGGGEICSRVFFDVIPL